MIGRESGVLALNGTALDYEADDFWTVRVVASSVGRTTDDGAENDLWINCTIQVKTKHGNSTIMRIIEYFFPNCSGNGLADWARLENKNT